MCLYVTSVGNLPVEIQKVVTKIIWWMSATERILLCMTDFSMSRNADVTDEVILKDAPFKMVDLQRWFESTIHLRQIRH